MKKKFSKVKIINQMIVVICVLSLMTTSMNMKIFAERNSVLAFGQIEINLSDVSQCSQPCNMIQAFSVRQTLEDYLKDSLMNQEAEIDVSEYDLSASEDLGDITQAYYYAIANDIELFYVESTFSYVYDVRTGVVVKLIPKYSLENYEAKKNALQNEINKALSVVDDCMSDVEKALAIHDYLAILAEYDHENLLSNTIPDDSYKGYGILVNHVGVCQGYAGAYAYLMKKLGIECFVVSSEAMNHAWNMIYINGNYYHVDVTYDDPVVDQFGRVCHNNFLVSDTKMLNELEHQGWEAFEASDTSFDTAFWTDIESSFEYFDGKWYYVGSNNINCYDFSMNRNETITAIPDNWFVWGSTDTCWSGCFSSVAIANNFIYYNTPTRIYQMNTDGTNKQVVFNENTENGYIYGIAFRDGELYYRCTKNPNEVGSIVSTGIKRGTSDIETTYSQNESITEIVTQDSTMELPTTEAIPETATSELATEEETTREEIISEEVISDITSEETTLEETTREEKSTELTTQEQTTSESTTQEEITQEDTTQGIEVSQSTVSETNTLDETSFPPVTTDSIMDNATIEETTTLKHIVQELTTVESTTQEPAVDKVMPIEVKGLVVTSPDYNTICVSWVGTNVDQVYDVYINGALKSENIMEGTYVYDGIAAGECIIRVVAKYNGIESSGVEKKVTVTELLTTIQESITQDVIIPDPTTLEETSESITTQTVTEEDTSESFTKEVVTREEVVTQPPTTEIVTREESSEPLTTEDVIREEVTTQPSTTEEITKEEVTTQPSTTEVITREEETEASVTDIITQKETSESLNVEHITTEGPTESQLLEYITSGITGAPATTSDFASKNVAIQNDTLYKKAKKVDEKTEVGKTKIKKVTKIKNVKVTLKKVAGAHGYQIQYSTSKKFQKVTVKTTKKLTYIIRKIKKNRNYYVRARAYKLVNGNKIFGSWSKAVKFEYNVRRKNSCK